MKSNNFSLSSGLNSLKDYWKQDLKAGFNVSLLALPLCLGIAIASGFPPAAGLFAAVVGGLLVSRLNGSYLTIAGPAAGLIVVNLAAIESLGQGDAAAGYPHALGAIVLAGALVTLLGLMRAGKLGDFFPDAAVHGMLAAIGVIIMAKQLFVMLGVRAHGHEVYELLAEVPIAIRHANPEVAIIGLASLAVLVLYPRLRWKAVRLLPAPIWVLAVAVPLELLLDFEHEHEVLFLGEVHKVGPQFLVHLPESLASAVAFPSFEKIGETAFWTAVLAIGLVTALESMLSTIAVDALDPWGRKSNLDKDVAAMGLGTSVSGLIGGLPMISEIVRSSANVNAGARTQWANFFHAALLLLFMVALKPAIEHIPLAALAAMLVFTGYRLASPKEFLHMHHIGPADFAVFSFTTFMVLATDLLLGIGAGIALHLAILLAKGVPAGKLFRASLAEEVFSADCVIISVEGPLAFSNYLSLKSLLEKHRTRKIINIDLAEATMVDHTVRKHLHRVKLEREAEGLEFNLIDAEHLNPVSGHPLAEMRASAGAFQQVLNGRAQEMLDFGAAHGWAFQAGAVATPQDWSSFPSFLGKAIRWKQNALRKQVGGINLVLADISFKSGAQLTAHEHQMSALVIEFDGRPIPAFTLEKEQLFDKLLGKAGWTDINFEAHPEFSDFYLLKGEDQEMIRAYFTEEIILFLESHKGYHIESNGQALLVYKDQRLLHAKGLLQLVAFSLGLLKRLSLRAEAVR